MHKSYGIMQISPPFIQIVSCSLCTTHFAKAKLVYDYTTRNESVGICHCKHSTCRLLDINRIIPLHVQIRAVPLQLQERRIQQTLLLFISAQQNCRPAIRLPIALLQPQGGGTESFRFHSYRILKS